MQNAVLLSSPRGGFSVVPPLSLFPYVCLLPLPCFGALAYARPRGALPLAATN